MDRAKRGQSARAKPGSDEVAERRGTSRALHPNSDELFLVLDGKLTIELRDGEVVLGPRDMYVVPKGVEHRPVAEVETSIMMVELQGTVNTGDAGGDRTFEPIDLV